MTAKLLPLDALRAAQENIARRKADRLARFDAEKAAYESDIQALDAELAELEVAKRVWEKLLAEAEADGPTPNGPDRHAEPEADNAEEEDDAEETDGETVTPDTTENYKTHKEMVLEAVRAAPGSMRHQIEKWIEGRYKIAVPPPSISTYLKRLRDDDGLIENPGEGLIWRPLRGTHQ